MANLTGFDFHQSSFLALVNDPDGGVARALLEEGERVVTASREYVGTQWSGGRSDPPQPFRRSGDLQASIRAERPRVIDGVIQVQVVADAAHRGWLYPQILREGADPLRGPYQFVDLDSLS